MNKLFVDVENYDELSEIIKKLDDYALVHDMDIYLMSYPKSDTPVLTNTDCFMIMSKGYKISLIKKTENDIDFDNYKEDINDTISYLFQKYEYRQELGRYKTWINGLLMDSSIKELDDLDNFWEKRILNNIEEKRKSQLLISLCTGSINDIYRVKNSLPQNLLDKVKQRIQLFDADQTRFIYQDIEKDIIKIQGLSGTGKTELLLHKLKTLYVNDKKYKIFITCHNRILADSLRTRIPSFFDYMKVSQQIEWNERLWCTHAWGSTSDINSGFYRYICYFYKIPFRVYTSYYTFDRVCKEALEYLNDIDDDEFECAFDYVLIDESQDFKPSFIELCKKVTARKVFLAGDIFQSIFSNFEKNDYEADYFLTKCYRTDYKTLMFAQALGLGLFESKRLRWLSKENWEACGYNYNDLNEKIELTRQPMHRFDDNDEDIESVIIDKFIDNNPVGKVVELIKEIRNEYSSVTPDDICIIMLDKGNHIYDWANWIEKEIDNQFDWEINKAYETKMRESGRILISNRNNVKGLEYPFIICITKELIASYEYRNAIYTMLSRSFLISYLLISDKSDNGLTKEITDGLKEIITNHKMVINKPSEQEIKDIETNFVREQSTITKPYIDIIKDIIKELCIPDSKRDMIINIILNNVNWNDYDIITLKEKVKKLSEII